jgi:hypothetical protein
MLTFLNSFENASIVLFRLMILLFFTSSIDAFVPLTNHGSGASMISSRAAAVVATDFIITPTVVSTGSQLTSTMDLLQLQQPQLDMGIRSYIIRQREIPSSTISTKPTTTIQSSSMFLSLQDRKIPTKEEIEQKKLTFNVIFWGGGFVAPFIATVFYFGFRFWEK